MKIVNFTLTERYFKAEPHEVSKIKVKFFASNYNQSKEQCHDLFISDVLTNQSRRIAML